MKLIYRVIIYCLFFFSGFAASAQSKSFGAWNILAFKLNLDKHWSIFQEFQLRSQLFYNNFSYYEVKGGASRSLSKNIAVLAGGGRFITYSDGDNFKMPYINKEWRIWEQFLVNNYAGRLKFENRIRIEQRWTSNVSYRNRFKYRLNIVLPITHKKIIPGTFYLNGWNEIYLTNNNPHFEQNKIYLGTGYEVSKLLTVQSGYVHQVSYKPDDSHAGKNYFQFTLLVEANTHKEHHEKTTSSAD